MIKSKDIFLKEIANLPELKENTLALVFALNPDIDILKREKFFDNVLPFYQRYQQDKPKRPLEISLDTNQKELEKWKQRDLRIKKIKIKSIGGFPDTPIPYGINFLNEKQEPQSMIILGSNGTGKSSLYGAIEYCYCAEVSEAKLRNFKPTSSNRYKEFLQHRNNSISTSYCEIDIVDSDIKQLKFNAQNIPEIVRKKINPNTHLISDWDIYSNGQLDYLSSEEKSFHYLIANSLGLNEHLEFEKQLKKFIFYSRQTESRRISGLHKNISSQKEVVSSRNEAIRQKKAELEKLKETQTIIPDEKNIQEQITLIGKIKQTNFAFTFDYSLLLTQVNSFKQSYREYSARKTKSGVQNEIQFLNIGLELLNEFNHCPFCESSTKTSEVIKKDVTARIESINSMNRSLQELNKSLNDVSESLFNLNNQIGLVRGRVTNELSLIQDKPEFNELTQSENRFLVYISKFIGEELLAELSKLNDNPSFQKDKSGYLYELLSSQDEYLQTSLSEFLKNISQFPTKRQEQIQAIDKLIAERATGKSAAEQKAILENDIRNFEQQIKDAEKIIFESEKEALKFQEQQQLFDTIKSETRELQKAIHAKLSLEVEQAFDPIKSTVEQILDYYFQLSGRKIKVEIEKKPEVDTETGEVLSETISASIIFPGTDEKPIEVNRFFNTFHYRLFCTIVSISIAIASRINTRINIPLILDDVFYATDFENRITIERFIKSIFQLFERYTEDMPLQLILFTHDQLIFESALKASNKNKIETLNFAKLYKQEFAKQEDDYLNLIYIFPKYLPQAIVDSILIEA